MSHMDGSDRWYISGVMSAYGHEVPAQFCPYSAFEKCMIWLPAIWGKLSSFLTMKTAVLFMCDYDAVYILC